MNDDTATVTLTPAELRDARHEFGLSTQEFAKLVNVESGRTVRRWEAEDRDIPGPVMVIVRALLTNAAVRRHFGITLGNGPARVGRPPNKDRRRYAS